MPERSAEMNGLRQAILRGLHSDLEDVRLSNRWTAGGYKDEPRDPPIPVRPSEDLSKAGVLVPIIEYDSELTILMTRRTDDMPSHAGEIVFPGGGTQPGDQSVVHTALRETEEEIGLERRFVDVVGFLDSYPTASGYLMQPVVGFVHPGFDIEPCSREVADVFEVPLGFVLEAKNYGHYSGDLGYGHMSSILSIRYEDHLIWGATAAILRNLRDVAQG